MHRIDQNEAQLSVSPAGFTLESARQRGEAMAWSARIAPGVFDLLKLQRSVRTLCADTRDSAVARALALEAAFGPLSSDAAAQVAVGVVCSLRDEQLRALARGALLTLRDAVSLAPIEAGSASLLRLDEELERRGELMIHDVDGVRIVADEISGELMALALAKIVQLLSHPGQRHLVDGKLALITLPDERKASDDLLRAHLETCVRRTFGNKLVLLPTLFRLDAQALELSAPPVQTGLVRTAARDLVRSIFLKRQPVRIPMALRASIQPR